MIKSLFTNSNYNNKRSYYPFTYCLQKANWIFKWKGCYSVSETGSPKEKIQVLPKGVEQISDFFFQAACVTDGIKTFSSVYSPRLKFTVTFLSWIFVVLTSLMLPIEQISHLLGEYIFFTEVSMVEQSWIPCKLVICGCNG